MQPVFERKASSRVSTGRTNRDEAAPVTAPAPKTGESGNAGSRAGTGQSGKAAKAPAARKPQKSVRRESSAEMRDRVTQDLKDAYDRHILVDRLFEKIYRSTSKTREAFRSFDPEGKGIIPVDEFFDAVGSRFCMVFSERERQLLRQHLDKDSDGTIDYKEFLDKFDQPCNVYEKAVKPSVPPIPSEATPSQADIERSVQGSRAVTASSRPSRRTRTRTSSSVAREKKRAETEEHEKLIEENKKLVAKIRQRIFQRGLRLTEVFKHIDANGDGFLTAGEMKAS